MAKLLQYIHGGNAGIVYSSECLPLDSMPIRNEQRRTGSVTVTWKTANQRIRRPRLYFIGQRAISWIPCKMRSRLFGPSGIAWSNRGRDVTWPAGVNRGTRGRRSSGMTCTELPYRSGMCNKNCRTIDRFPDVRIVKNSFKMVPTALMAIVRKNGNRFTKIGEVLGFGATGQ